MIQQILGFLLLFFLTGITFIYALFPRKGEMDPQYDLLYRFTFGVVMSVVILILFGFSLNALGTDTSGFGYVTSSNLWIGLTVLTIFFFLAGWWRGAYPWMGRLHKSLRRYPRSPAHSVLAELNEDKETFARFSELAGRREKLRRELKDIERRIKLQTGEMKEHYLKKRIEVQENLKKVDDELRELERKRSEALYVK